MFRNCATRRHGGPPATRRSAGSRRAFAPWRSGGGNDRDRPSPSTSSGTRRSGGTPRRSRRATRPTGRSGTPSRRSGASRSVSQGGQKFLSFDNEGATRIAAGCLRPLPCDEGRPRSGADGVRCACAHSSVARRICLQSTFNTVLSSASNWSQRTSFRIASTLGPSGSPYSPFTPVSRIRNQARVQSQQPSVADWCCSNPVLWRCDVTGPARCPSLRVEPCFGPESAGERRCPVPSVGIACAVSVRLMSINSSRPFCRRTGAPRWVPVRLQRGGTPVRTRIRSLLYPSGSVDERACGRHGAVLTKSTCDGS
jgi:hypothetical protein